MKDEVIPAENASAPVIAYRIYTIDKLSKRLGIYTFDDVEVIDFSAPFGVFAVAQRMDPELDVFLIGDSQNPVQTTAGMNVMPRYSRDQDSDMDAFLIPGGAGTRREMHNERLHEFVENLSNETLLVSVCTGSWVYGKAGLLDDRKATNRKYGDPSEDTVPIERLAEIAPRPISTTTGSPIPAAL